MAADRIVASEQIFVFSFDYRFFRKLTFTGFARQKI